MTWRSARAVSASPAQVAEVAWFHLDLRGAYGVAVFSVEYPFCYLFGSAVGRAGRGLGELFCALRMGAPLWRSQVSSLYLDVVLRYVWSPTFWPLGEASRGLLSRLTVFRLLVAWVLGVSVLQAPSWLVGWHGVSGSYPPCLCVLPDPHPRRAPCRLPVAVMVMAGLGAVCRNVCVCVKWVL